MKNSHNTGSPNGAIELEPQTRNFPTSSNEQRLNPKNISSASAPNAHNVSIPEREPDLETLSAESQHQPPAVVAHALEQWNEPSVNVSRVFATFWSFVIMGANDAAYGVSSIFKIRIYV
jgi:hypothetical protein